MNGDNMKDMQVKNLSIGWVVKVIADRYCLTPGYTPVRKIIYRDYDEFGFDLLYHNNYLPIIYPIVDFNEEDKANLLENGEYVILPCGTINTYLNSFGININKMSLLKKYRISKLVFSKSIIERTSLFRKKVNLEKYKEELKKLENFKIINCSDSIGEYEHQYLVDFTNVKILTKRYVGEKV